MNGVKCPLRNLTDGYQCCTCVIGVYEQHAKEASAYSPEMLDECSSNVGPVRISHKRRDVGLGCFFSGCSCCGGRLPRGLHLLPVGLEDGHQPDHAPPRAEALHLRYGSFLAQAVVYELTDLVPDDLSPAIPRSPSRLRPPSRAPRRVEGFYRGLSVYPVPVFFPHLADRVRGAIYCGRGPVGIGYDGEFRGQAALRRRGLGDQFCIALRLLLSRNNVDLRSDRSWCHHSDRWKGRWRRWSSLSSGHRQRRLRHRRAGRELARIVD